MTELQRKKFHEHLRAWKQEKMFQSSMRKIEGSSHYQAIIAMGQDIIPLILQELQSEPDWLFSALHQITKECPATPSEYGNLVKLTVRWLHWGEQKGLV